MTRDLMNSKFSFVSSSSIASNALIRALYSSGSPFRSAIAISLSEIMTFIDLSVEESWRMRFENCKTVSSGGPC